MELRLAVVWWIVCVLWSSTFLFIKLGLRDIPPFTFAWMRLAIAVSVLLPLAIGSRSWRSLTRRDVGLLAVTGVLLLGVNYALVFWGSQFVASGLVAILQSAIPLLALAFGWWAGSEGVTPRKLFSVGIGIAGVIIIFGAEASTSGAAALRGSIAAFAGSICVALAYVWLKTYGQGLPRTTVTALQSVAGLIPLACIGLALEGIPEPARWSLSAWAALLYLSLVGSVIALWLNYWLLARMDTSSMLMMGVAEVPIAVALGAAVFGERLPSGTLLGGCFVLAGVIATLTGAPTQSTPNQRRMSRSTNDLVDNP